MNMLNTYHFSIDDVHQVFDNINFPEGAIQQNHLIKLLKDWHQRYEACCELYFFNKWKNEERWFSIKSISTTPFLEFKEKTWLRWGPHGEDFDTPPHMQTEDNRKNTIVSGFESAATLFGKNNICRSIRLHYFSECPDLIPILHRYNIHTLLLTDKEAISYVHDEGVKKDLEKNGCCKHQGIMLRRSNTRVESMLEMKWSAPDIKKYIEDIIRRHRHFELFTHEAELNRPEVIEITDYCLSVLNEMKARSL